LHWKQWAPSNPEIIVHSLDELEAIVLPMKAVLGLKRWRGEIHYRNDMMRQAHNAWERAPVHLANAPKVVKRNPRQKPKYPDGIVKLTFVSDPHLPRVMAHTLLIMMFESEDFETWPVDRRLAVHIFDSIAKT
jgi:hypothetical protein